MEVRAWQDVIGKDVKFAIDIDLFASNYLHRIKRNIQAGEPLNYAVRHAKNDLVAILSKRGIKAHDIIHLLHFCGMAIFPAMYAGCGCHEHLRNKNFNN